MCNTARRRRATTPMPGAGGPRWAFKRRFWAPGGGATGGPPNQVRPALRPCGVVRGLVVDIAAPSLEAIGRGSVPLCTGAGLWLRPCAKARTVRHTTAGVPLLRHGIGRALWMNGGSRVQTSRKRYHKRAPKQYRPRRPPQPLPHPASKVANLWDGRAVGRLVGRGRAVGRAIGRRVGGFNFGRSQSNSADLGPILVETCQADRTSAKCWPNAGQACPN